MMRLFLASVLVFAHLASLGAPVGRVRPATAEGMGCEGSAVQVGHGFGAVVAGGIECHGCDFPDCHAMPGCAGTAPAVTNESSVGFVLLLSLAEETDLASRRGDGARSPILPPPRA